MERRPPGRHVRSAGPAAPELRPLTDRIGEPELDGDRARIRGRRRFPPDEPFFAGHFPAMPVVPGVFMVEALVACATRLLVAIAGTGTRSGGWAPALVSIPAVRFRRRVEPGDVLELEAVVAAREEGRFRIAASGSVGGRRAVEATLLFR